MAAFRNLVLLVRFLLELAMLASFGIWGYNAGGSWWLKIGLAIGLPLLAAAVWGIFMAPRSSRRLREPYFFLLELGIFGLAIAAVYDGGQCTLAGSFGLVYVLHRIWLGL
jgi:hypothetical protein